MWQAPCRPVDLTEEHRGTPLTRHALAGDEHDVPLLRVLLAGFPPDAVGEVLLELPDSAGVTPHLPTPSGLTVRRVRRGAHDRPGVPACTALGAWVEEWVLGEHASAEGHAIFLGMPDNPLVENWFEAMRARNASLHVHRPRRLGAPL